MAYDKIIDSQQFEANLTNIANAIRTAGELDPEVRLQFPNDFTYAIGQLTGESVTVEPLSVTENGTYTAPSGTAYNPVTVVSKDTEMLKSLVERTITTVHLDVNTTGASAFNGCGNLETAVFPKATVHYGTSLATCPKLRAVDTSTTNINTNCFLNSTTFSSLVLRANSVCTLTNVGVFGGTPFASGKAGGTLYVPNALIASYQAATNWSALFGENRDNGYANNQILSIEGSYYETHYADGTPIGGVT